MKKEIVLAVVVFALLASSLVVVGTVKAQYVSTDVKVTYGSLNTYVNQRVEFTATCNGGTPPYTYQWYAQLWPTWKPGMGYHLSPIGSEVAVSGATSNIFDFTTSTNGTYSISLGITDSEGKYTMASFLPGLWVFVLPSSTSSSPTPPQISFLFPENTTYTGNEMPLNFTVSKPAAEICYNIDCQANITVAGNTTLTALPNGAHNLTVYVTDTDGLSAFGTTYFSIAAPQQKPTANPTLQPASPQTPWLLATVVIVAPLVAGLAFGLIKKRRSKRLTSSEL